MDAIKFISERKRMCEKYGMDCTKCPLAIEANKLLDDYDCIVLMENEPEKTVQVVEGWSKANPIMTNSMKFEEVFGDKPISHSRTLYCPPSVDLATCNMVSCDECLKWWDEPYKEPEHE